MKLRPFDWTRCALWAEQQVSASQGVRNAVIAGIDVIDKFVHLMHTRSAKVEVPLTLLKNEASIADRMPTCPKEELACHEENVS